MIRILAATTVVAGCASAPPAAAGGSATSLGPSQDVLDVLHNAFPAVSTVVIKTITEIEGFNDSQALPDDGTTDMGPYSRLYIVPVRFLEKDFEDTWRLTAVMEIDGLASMPNSYKNIGIKDNPALAQYCVYLQKRMNGSGGNYKWIGSIATVENDKCKPADEGVKINDVAEERHAGATKKDFPSVVRFDQDKNGKAIIGVNCGETVWCELGRPDGPGNRLEPIHTALGTQQTKKHLIKSWHDEQEIVGSTLKRLMRASVTPDENLGDYTMLDFTEPAGVPVAHIFLEKAVTDPNSKYAKWGLAQGNNTLRLYAQERSAEPGKYDWWGIFTTAAGASNNVRFSVRPMVHAINPPPVARWKWDPTDEEIWVACDQGCCTVSGFQSDVAIRTFKNE